ncbi:MULTISPECIES: glutathione S-transferase family protein [unclassified Rhizobacter]|uniref:glutathione S-transferase family protein n=1 Tax=unclassified Rhizobacter TaxID=2640088 RepID=UPI0006FE7826|nr:MULTISPECIES: glutathione S-transferase family protein [unclassified Rhizobacter]KQU76940.1 glutathione S-transferase [Rhizobacter sp. Root29]KQV97461.1 glutathione S-transferase [Rhizobacter sp. Root1238]KRB10132.1 glutathione S-transferase [Rhizobacter sp. Root16D2]
MLKIWGNADSINVQKVLWCCEELALPYERIDAGRHYGVVNTAEFRRLNPNGLVPTIEDDGFVVWESGTVLRYLAAKHAAGSLWPDDVVARAEADRWVDWSNSTLWPAMVPIFRAFLRTPEHERDDNLVEAARRETLEALTILDAQLEGRAFVGGDRFTMGDIALGCAVWRWMSLPIERDELPQVQRWFDALSKREAYRKVVMLPLV